MTGCHGPGVPAHPQGASSLMKRLYENGCGHLLTLDPRGPAVQAGILPPHSVCAELARAEPMWPREGQGRRGQGGTAVTETPISVSELLTDPAGVPRARAICAGEWVRSRLPRYEQPRWTRSCAPPPGRGGQAASTPNGGGGIPFQKKKKKNRLG